MSQVRCLPAPGGNANLRASRSLLSVVGQAEQSKPSTAAHFPNPPTAEAQFIQSPPNCHSARERSRSLAQYPRGSGHAVQWLGT